MKIQDLEAKIKDRADASVAAKVKVFRNEIDAALGKLFGNGSQTCERFGKYMYAGRSGYENVPQYEIAHAKLTALRIAIQDGQPHPSTEKVGWPQVLWDREIESIRDELLSKMDLMQQILTVKPRLNAGEDDISPEE